MPTPNKFELGIDLGVDVQEQESSPLGALLAKPRTPLQALLEQPRNPLEAVEPPKPKQSKPNSTIGTMSAIQQAKIAEAMLAGQFRSEESPAWDRSSASKSFTAELMRRMGSQGYTGMLQNGPTPDDIDENDGLREALERELKAQRDMGRFTALEREFAARMKDAQERQADKFAGYQAQVSRAERRKAFELARSSGVAMTRCRECKKIGCYLGAQEPIER